MLPMNTRLRNPRRSLVSSPVSAPVSSYQPFSPLALQPRLWLDASDLTTITESGGAVSEWRDKSGNGYAFTQATSTAQPTTGTTTQNGLNVISFDGVDDFMVSTAAASEWKFLHDGTEYLFGAVVRRSVAGVQGFFYSTQNLVGGIQQIGARVVFNVLNNWGTVVYNASNQNIIVATTSLGTATTVPRVISGRIAPAAIAVSRATTQLDGDQPTTNNTQTGTLSTANPYATLHLGVQATATTQFLGGFIAELVFVTGSAATNQGRQILHNYLNAKWSVY